MTDKLKRLATAMYSVAKAVDLPQQHQWERGSVLTLWRDGEDWILSLTRKGVPPGAKEVDTCKECFNIPASVQAEAEAEPVNGYYIVRLRWREGHWQQGSFNGGESEPPNQYQGGL